MSDDATKSKDTAAHTILLVNLADSYVLRTRTLNDFCNGNHIKQLDLPPQTPKPVEEKIAIQTIVDALRKELKEHGTVGELRFSGHGDSNRMYLLDDKSKRIDLSNLLNALAILQQETGIKIADKISFIGCNTFTNEKTKWVGYYRDMSKILGAELVGATDFVSQQSLIPIPGMEYQKLISFKDGQIGHFTPSHQSLLAMPSLLITKICSGLLGVEHSDEWVQHHEGHTQAEGAHRTKHSGRALGGERKP